MITNSKIDQIQSKIKAAIAKIEKEENVKIEFGSIRYNSAKYNTTMSVSTLEKNEKVDNIYLSLCKSVGFTQNVIGMQFDGRNGTYEVIDIHLKNRKYPVIAKSLKDGKEYKYQVSHIKRLIGGDKIINRNANLDKLIN
jgi:hypothetical protein